jgi:hypothetical protein
MLAGILRWYLILFFPAWSPCWTLLIRFSFCLSFYHHLLTTLFFLYHVIFLDVFIIGYVENYSKYSSRFYSPFCICFCSCCGLIKTAICIPHFFFVVSHLSLIRMFVVVCIWLIVPSIVHSSFLLSFFFLYLNDNYSRF